VHVFRLVLRRVENLEGLFVVELGTSHYKFLPSLLELHFHTLQLLEHIDEVLEFVTLVGRADELS
jgi:hypothetical protein